MPNYGDSLDAGPIYPPPGQQKRQPAPQYAPPPARQFSLLEYLRSSCSLVLMAGFICAAVVALSTTLYPITHMYCKAIGIGCGPDRHANSRGMDFFDCLNDLWIIRQRQQDVGTSDLATLSTMVMQFEHILKGPEDLRDNLAKLVELKKDILYNAKPAGVLGPSSSKLTDISSRLSHAGRLVVRQAREEISRLRNIQDRESVLSYLAYELIGPFWKIFQPGWDRRKEQDAALFLGEVIQEIDEGVIPMIGCAERALISLQYSLRIASRAFSSSQEPYERVVYLCSVGGVCAPYRRSTGEPW